MQKVKPKKNTQEKLIVGIGSALVDILVRESDGFLAQAGAKKGGMTLVDSAGTIENILKQTTQKTCIVPGGSACNTILGIGKLGGRARFVGKRGGDELGALLEKALADNNVEPRLFMSPSATGRVLSIITPDAQRSMFTFLGASAETKPEEILAEQFKGAALVHIEGYLLFNEKLIRAALDAAKKAGALVSLDLASYTVVEASKNILEDLVRDYVDILIANEDEARAFTGLLEEEKALEALSQKATTAVVKVGKRGSYIAHKGKTTAIGIMGDGSAVDTTGAGDLWASGFLYGLVNGYPIDKAGKIGAACGYEVCQVVGAQIPEEGWRRIRKLL
ncbi:MAG TPA: adenosine kinase [Chitinivibrionales bacterium]|nr:adenosine kinase [Chitinivibrionales bacterium]